MPIEPVKLPTIIAGQNNGDVDPALLWTVEADKTSTYWLMAELPARGMRAFHAAAMSAGIVLGSTGRGRTLSQQWTIFGGSQARYRPTDVTEYNATPSSNRKFWGLVDYVAPSGLKAPGRGTVSKLLKVLIPNSSYWVKIQQPNGGYPATAAVPGTSNHGFYSADDLAEFVNGVMLQSIRAATLQWLYANARRFGFAWELTSENWHVHWIMGDVLPQAVLDFENPYPAPVPHPPEPPVDSDMMITIYKLSDALAQFVAYTVNGVALQVEWSGDGNDPAVVERLSILKHFGAVEITVSVADIGRTTLIGPLPHGDPLHDWQSSDFLKHIQ